MSDSDATPARSPATLGEPGINMLAAGALLLLVSLFLDWYQPGLSAWTVFEVWDLVLAGLALAALAAAAGRLGFARERPDRWLLIPSVAAFVIVVASLLNHPPLAIGHDPMIGIWLALAASLLMLAGVALSVARVSVAIRLEDGAPGASGFAGTGLRGRARFPRRSSASPAAAAAQRVAESAGPASEETQATRVLKEDPARPGPPGEPR